MTDQEIKKIVNKCLIEEFELQQEALVPDASIKNDLDLDSLDIVDMVVVLEKAFDFKLTNREDITKLRRLGDIYTYIAELRDSGIVGTH